MAVYDHIKEALLERILSGELPEGARVPSELALTKELEVSRNQTRQALHELALEGYLIRRQGSGSYVAPLPNHPAVPDVTGMDAVAIVIPKDLAGHSRGIVNGFLEQAAREEVQVCTYQLHNSRTGEAEESRFLRSIVDSGVAGIVTWILYRSEGVQRILGELAARRFPVVLVDRTMPGLELDSVVSDNRALGYRLTRALVSRGHRRIAFAMVERRMPVSVEERLLGYRQALEEASVPFDDALVLSEAAFDDNPAETVKSILALRERPTAVVGTHLKPVRQFLEATHPFGYRVPDHLEVAVVDDEYPSGMPEVPMLRIRQSSHAMGVAGVKLMLARMAEPDRPFEHLVLEPGDIFEGCIPPQHTGGGQRVPR